MSSMVLLIARETALLIAHNAHETPVPSAQDRKNGEVAMAPSQQQKQQPMAISLLSFVGDRDAFSTRF